MGRLGKVRRRAASLREGEAPAPAVRIATEVAERHPGIGFCRPGDPAGVPRPVLLPREAHVMTFAPTGAGKTVSCVVPVLLQHEGPAIVLDPKGEIAAVTARRRREMGQDVHVIDPFGMSGLPASGFNPLDIIEPGAADGLDEAKVLSGTLMPTMFDARDVFWRSRAVHLLTATSLSAVSDYPASRRNMMTVRDIVHGLARAANRRTAGGREPSPAMRTCNPDVARIDDLLNLGAAETTGGIVHTALEGVGFVQGPLVERSLRVSSFRLDDVTEGAPMTIYLVMPPHMLVSHGVMLRLWLGTLFSALMRRRVGPTLPTLLLLDEAAQLGGFAPLQTAITLLRGYGVQTWSLWQDPSQLAQHYPQAYRTMLNNCRILQFFGATNDAVWRHAEELVGVEIDRFQLASSRRMLLVLDGQPVVADRIDYRTDAILAPLADLNPCYAAPHFPLRRQLPGASAGPAGDAPPHLGAMAKISAGLGRL